MFSRIKLTLIFGIFLSLVVKTQTATPNYFEGEIIYSNTYKSKDPKITDKRFAAMLGSVHNYFVNKKGDYKTVTNGMFAQWQLYINAQNKLYNKMAHSDTLFWNSGSAYDDQLLSAKVKKNALKVLGYDCDELILTCRSGVQKYYYSSKLAIDPNNYKKHLYGNYYNYISRAGAVPLKSIIEDAGFIMESTATKINPQQLSKSFFDLPLNVRTQESTY